MQKAALILEGGAKRGVFTSGVLDYLMEQEYYIPHVIGVSAGSCNAVDYVSRQPGRTKACMIRSGEDGKIINFHNFFQTKSLLDMDLIFERDPKELHPFDFDTYFASDMTCEIVVTNCESGQAEYYSEKEDGDRLMQLLQSLKQYAACNTDGRDRRGAVPGWRHCRFYSADPQHAKRLPQKRSDPDQKQRIPQDHIQTGYSDVSDGF